MNLKRFFERLSLKKPREVLRALGKGIWRALSQRLWMKLLSLLLAILLWNYVVTSNPSITREKVVTGLSGYLTNQTTLTNNKLALLDDAEEMMRDVSVRVEVPQASYSRVSADNIKVTLDLSSVRSAGTQQVPLKATTSYGTVTSIYPESLTLTIETLDSRVIPVNVQASGEKSDELWYSISRTNPVSITVSGAASVVRSLTQARVSSDVTGAEEGYVRAEPYALLNSEGEEVSQAMLSCSSSSITVTMEIYPTKELPISELSENVITGTVAEGYRIADISIQPETVTVAADGELLEGITELYVEPVSVDGLSQSLSARAKIIQLSDFKNISAEQVLVNVTIVEESITHPLEGIHVKYLNLPEGLTLENRIEEIPVTITGPRSTVEALEESLFEVTVDLSGLSEGEHSCEILFPTETCPDITFETEQTTLSVVLTREETAAEEEIQEAIDP